MGRSQCPDVFRAGAQSVSPPLVSLPGRCTVHAACSSPRLVPLGVLRPAAIFGTVRDPCRQRQHGSRRFHSSVDQNLLPPFWPDLVKHRSHLRQLLLCLAVNCLALCFGCGQIPSKNLALCRVGCRAGRGRLGGSVLLNICPLSSSDLCFNIARGNQWCTILFEGGFEPGIRMLDRGFPFLCLFNCASQGKPESRFIHIWIRVGNSNKGSLSNLPVRRANLE